MNDRFRVLFGLCQFKTYRSVTDVINASLRAQIELFDLYEKEDCVFFYCAVDQKKRLEQLISDAEYLKTTGVIGFLVSFFKKKFHWFLLVWLVLLYWFLSHVILEISFQSTSPDLQKKMETYLTDNGIAKGFYVNTEDFDEVLKQQLKTEFLHEIAWIEVRRYGSLLKISFNHKENAQVQSFSKEPLISYKHAVISRFEVLHGYKAVKLNQVVYPKDVLVQPYLMDSSGQMRELYVEGKVYGTTWTTVSSTINETGIDVLDFLRAVMSCRREIEKEISEGESVLKENILQVDSSEGKITIMILYVCEEEISRP